MLKSRRKTIKEKKSAIDDAEEWLEIDDKLLNYNHKLLFNKIFLDDKEYTVEALSRETNYSERSIFRKISLFERLIKILEEKHVESSEEKNKEEK